MQNVHIINHPLIQHNLTHMRMKRTNTAKFRQLLTEISMLMTFEVTRDIPLKKIAIETPLAKTISPVLFGKKLAIVSILRAGNGLLDGMLTILSQAKVGHIGLYRESNLKVVEYYYKMPHDMNQRECILVDPMLATGNSTVHALNKIIHTSNPLQIKFMCLLATPVGIEHVHNTFPQIPIYTAAIDNELNEHGYIIPGLGDAGDRIYGTQ